MSWDELNTDAIRLAHSPVETRRFGISISRLTVGLRVPPSLAREKEVAAMVRRTEDRIVVARFPAGQPCWTTALNDAGRGLIPGGALSYWEFDVSLGRSPSEPMEPLGTSVASIAESDDLIRSAEQVRAVIQEAFTGYQNHYTANPLLDQSLALEGYIEWAHRAVKQRPRDVFLLYVSSIPVGVATICVGADGDHVEVELAGLVPQMHGRGLYGVLLGALMTEAGRRGVRRLIISTQVHNVRVQRAWARSGLQPFAAVETVHAVAIH